jgi:hypothetical protein
MELDELVNRFRIAGRELFNHWFRVRDPYQNNGWELEERFSEIEALLFQKLVTEPAGLPNVHYGEPNPRIQLRLATDRAPIMVNRDKESGYWDHPINVVTTDAELRFITFFDWDQLAFRNNQYVRVLVTAWPSHPEVSGKHALIEAQYVKFAEA